MADIYDNDNDGHAEKTFGRIFYYKKTNQLSFTHLIWTKSLLQRMMVLLLRDSKCVH